MYNSGSAFNKTPQTQYQEMFNRIKSGIGRPAGYQPSGGYGGGGFAQTPAGQSGPGINQGGNVPLGGGAQPATAGGQSNAYQPANYTDSSGKDWRYMGGETYVSDPTLQLGSRVGSAGGTLGVNGYQDPWHYKGDTAGELNLANLKKGAYNSVRNDILAGRTKNGTFGVWLNGERPQRLQHDQDVRLKSNQAAAEKWMAENPKQGAAAQGTVAQGSGNETVGTNAPLQSGLRVGQMTRGLWQQLGQPIGYQPRGY